MSSTSSLLLWILAAEVCFAQSGARPWVSGVVDAADYSDQLVGIPRGSIFTVFGTDLAPSAAQPKALPLPSTLNGVKLRIWADYAMKSLLAEAPLLYVSPTQINAILPSTILAAQCYMTVAVGGLESSPTDAVVTNGRFAAFTQGGTGLGPAAIQQYDSGGQPRLNRLTSPAVPGEVMTLWGTGLGPLLSGSDADAPTAGSLRTDVAVLVAGVPIVPSYAGRAPGLPGVDQINFRLPVNVPRRCFVPLVVQTGGVSSGVVTVALSADGGPCESEFGLSAAALAVLDSGGVVRGAVLSVTSTTSGPTAIAQQTEAWMAEYDSTYLSILANADILPLANGDGVCSRRAYIQRLHGALPLLESNIYGLRRISGFLSASCLGQFLLSNDSVLQGFGCASPYWFTGSLAAPAAAFYVTGTLPPARPANIVNILGVESSSSQLSVSWTAISQDPNDRIVLTAGSHFNYGGNIFGPTSEVNELTCQVAADRSTLRFPQADLSWAFAKGTRSPVSVARTSVTDQLFPPGGSQLDFVLVRTRTATAATAPVD